MRVKCVKQPKRDGHIDNRVIVGKFYNASGTHRAIDGIDYFTIDNALGGVEADVPQQFFKVMPQRQKTRR